MFVWGKVVGIECLFLNVFFLVWVCVFAFGFLMDFFFYLVKTKHSYDVEIEIIAKTNIINSFLWRHHNHCQPCPTIPLFIFSPVSLAHRTSPS